MSIPLDLFVHVPSEAAPGQLNEGTLTRLCLTAAPTMGFAAIFSLLIYSHYDLTKERHSQMLDELEVQNFT